MLKHKDLISIQDLTVAEIEQIFSLTKQLKKKNNPNLLKGKVLGMIFEKSSTRTRVSFEVAMLQLGGHALFLSPRDIQIGRGETIEDTAKVLSGYVDGVMMRTYSHQMLTDFAAAASVPVINGLTDLSHPVQVLADLFTLIEVKKNLKPLKIVYIGDGANNMAHAWLHGAAKLGLHLVICAPAQDQPSKLVWDEAKAIAQKSKAKLEIEVDPKKAVENADVIYTDTWVSMGQEKEEAVRLKRLAPYQVNQKLVDKAKKEVVVMHCLPAHRGDEITAEVADGPHSIIFHEAENRLHVQKAILALLMSDKRKK